MLRQWTIWSAYPDEVGRVGDGKRDIARAQDKLKWHANISSAPPCTRAYRRLRSSTRPRLDAGATSSSLEPTATRERARCSRTLAPALPALPPALGGFDWCRRAQCEPHRLGRRGARGGGSMDVGEGLRCSSCGWRKSAGRNQPPRPAAIAARAAASGRAAPARARGLEGWKRTRRRVR